MLPDFIGLGAQKTGTTSLFNYLQGHPDICLASGKETNFFYKDALYSKGLKYYEEKFFRHCSPGTVKGEISPNYLYHTCCIERLLTLPNPVKFIIMFRNPIDRAYSNYWMEIRRGKEKLSFAEAVEREPERIKKGVREKNTYSYIHRGFYDEQVAAYMDAFPDAKFLFILSEDLKCDRQNTMETILRFLGVDAFAIDQTTFSKEHHTSSTARWRSLQYYIQHPHWSRKILKWIIPHHNLRQKAKKIIYNKNIKKEVPPPLNESLRMDLIRLYRPHNEKLGKMINRDLSHWNQSPS